MLSPDPPWTRYQIPTDAPDGGQGYRHPRSRAAKWYRPSPMQGAISVPLDVVETARRLIRIPSVNPMGRTVDGDIYLEHRLTDHLHQLLTGLGLPCERHPVAPGRDNLLARLSGGDELLMFQVHQDTVPVEGMTVEPWAAVLREGRIYGRGACDVKGGMACLLSVVSRLIEEPPRHMPTILLAFTVNEEFGFSGAEHLRSLWTGGHSALAARPPDSILVTEPTELNVVVAHKGIVRSALPDRRPCRAQLGTRIGRQRDLRHGPSTVGDRAVPTHDDLGHPPHPLLGRPTLNVGVITGGISVNTVPDQCSIELERRLLPHEEPAAAYRQTVQYLDQHGATDLPVQHEPPYLAAAGLTDQHNAALADRLANCAARRAWTARKRAYPSAPMPANWRLAACPPWCLGQARSGRPTPRTNGSRSLNCTKPRRSSTSSSSSAQPQNTSRMKWWPL